MWRKVEGDQQGERERRGEEERRRGDVCCV